MNRTNDLDRLDRATLRAWRISNLVAWGAVAAFAGYVGSWIAMSAASATANVLGGGLAAQAAMAVLYAALVGAVIGWMVGAHVYRSPRAVAGVAAVVASFLFPQVGSLIIPWAVGLVVTAAAQIGSALAVAQVAWRRRPAALRAG